MKKAVLLPALFLLAFITAASAQALSTPDTIRVKGFKTYLGQERIKNPNKLNQVMLGLHDPQIDKHLRSEKSFESFSWVLGLGGAVLMGIGGYNSLNGKLTNGKMYIGGGMLTLGSGVLSFFSGKHRKEAYNRYNDIQLGRYLPVAPPMPAVLLPDPVSADASAVKQPERPTTPLHETPHPPVGSSGAYLGIAAGIGWSKQHINYAFAYNQDFQAARAYTFGFQYGRSFSERLGWQLELDLTQHGYRLDQTFTSNGVKIKAKADARLRYLEIPFLLAYRLPIGGKGLGFSILPGFSLGYAVSGKVVARGSGESETRQVHTKITDEISLKEARFDDRLDAALLLGAQAAYPFGPGKAFVEVRYHLGILNLDRNADSSITEEGDKAFNRTLMLRLGYRYAL